MFMLHSNGSFSFTVEKWRHKQDHYGEAISMAHSTTAFIFALRKDNKVEENRNCDT